MAHICQMLNDTILISHDLGCEMRQFMGSHNLGQKHGMAVSNVTVPAIDRQGRA
jgi:hypothetical protein